jgi:hypothetical protein
MCKNPFLLFLQNGLHFHSASPALNFQVQLKRGSNPILAGPKIKSIFWGTPFDKNPKYLFLTEVRRLADPLLVIEF